MIYSRQSVGNGDNEERESSYHGRSGVLDKGPAKPTSGRRRMSKYVLGKYRWWRRTVQGTGQEKQAIEQLWTLVGAILQDPERDHRGAQPGRACGRVGEVRRSPG